MMYTYGCYQSKLTGNESEFEENKVQVNLFDKYDISSQLSSVRDQGSTPKCVSVALTDMILWRMKSDKTQPDFKFDDNYFFINRKDKNTPGMTPLEAFNILKNKGVQQGVLLYKSSYFAKVNSYIAAKKAITLNGPVMLCMLVKSESDEFWNGSQNLGGHAVLLTGYDNSGFILRNSWGYSWANGGYSYISNEDFNKAYECWTLIG